jgi:hypothetical protein
MKPEGSLLCEILSSHSSVDEESSLLSIIPLLRYLQLLIQYICSYPTYVEDISAFTNGG